MRRFRGSLTQLWHPLSYASRFTLPLARKAGFRLAGWPLPGGSQTLWTTSKGFRSHVVPLSCSPDATFFRPDRIFPRPSRAAAAKNGACDGSENVIMRCRSGSSPEVGSGDALAVARQEGLDDAHVTAATWAGMLWRFQLFGLSGDSLDGVDRDEPHREQGADTSDVVGTCWAGQQAVVADTVEALGQHMHPEEIVCLYCRPRVSWSLAGLRISRSFFRICCRCAVRDC
jgi:hypothetical protein